ncbi:MAG: hypothetical protein COB61_004855 [Thiotrichales bacterium]|nr:hypothetical protein [Thiotrichales bacterium]
MNTKPTWIRHFSAIALSLLAACSHTTTTEVDRLSLLRSMIYTQQHLLEIELTEDRESDRYAILLNSYCDLTDREMIDVNETPAQCKVERSVQKNICVAKFHRCISSCDSHFLYCSACEQKAMLCLAGSRPSQP